MKKILFSILILFCIYITGCSIPRVASYPQLYSFIKEEKKIRSGFTKKKVISIKDFRKNEMYEEDIIALKEKIEEYISHHPDLSELTKNNLRELKITKGSTQEEVKLLRGKPDKVRAGIWIYRINKMATFTIFIIPVFYSCEAYYLYFKDASLTAIERHYLQQTVSSSGMGLFESPKESSEKIS